MNERVFLIDGAFVPAKQASLHVSDLLIQRGYGVFDVFRTVNGRFVFLADHLARLYRSAAAMHLPIPLREEDLAAKLDELTRRNQLPDSRIRITVTGGKSADAYTIGTPGIVITQESAPRQPAKGQDAFRLMTWKHRRQMPHVKSLDYMMAVWLQPTLRQRGLDDVLYTHDGLVSECPRSNFYLVTSDGALVTPGAGILEGVTRKHVLALAKEQCPVEVRDVRVSELSAAREAFITSTTKGILPVTEIDGRAIGDGRPGAIARKLNDALEELVDRQTTAPAERQIA